MPINQTEHIKRQINSYLNTTTVDDTSPRQVSNFKNSF